MGFFAKDKGDFDAEIGGKCDFGARLPSGTDADFVGLAVGRRDVWGYKIRLLYLLEYLLVLDNLCLSLKKYIMK